MAVDIMLDVQKEVYDLLIADAGVDALVNNRIYDNIPEQETFPYIVIGRNDTFDDHGSHTTNGFSGDLQIDVWDNGRGAKTTKQVMAAIYTVLHKTELTITGHSTINLRRASTSTLIEDDGVTYHGISRYTFIIAN
jgi:hypothetical protein